MSNNKNNVQQQLKLYTKPVLKQLRTLGELTQGFSGSLPDAQGGHTKRNPF